MSSISKDMSRSKLYLDSPLAKSDEIRLLHLEPGILSEVIRCSLESVKLSNTPWYEALSYEWGETGNEKPIKLNGMDFEIRQNLHTALKHLRYETEPRILWVDALCINQNDTDERNLQVAQMGAIYSQAESVTSWLGLPDDSTIAALKFVDSITPAQFDQYEHCENFAEVFGLDLAIGEGHELLKGFQALFRKNYWRRVWIIQEVFLASKLQIMCGKYCMSEDTWTFMQNCQAFLTMSEAYSPNTPYYYLMVYLIEQRWWCRRQPENSSRTDPLLEQALWHRDAECSNVLDKIFGLMAMTPQRCQDAVKTDYDSTLEALLSVAHEHQREDHQESYEMQFNDQGIENLKQHLLSTFHVQFSTAQGAQIE